MIADLRSRLAALLRGQAAAFAPLARRVASRLGAEDVHDLRVLTRRARAAVWVARRMASDPGLPRLRTALRALGRALGRRRMMDVVSLDARTYGLDAGRLAAPLACAGDAVVRTLAPARVSGLRTLLRRAAASVARPAGDRIGEGLALRARRLRRAHARAPRGKLQMHRLRIEAKKVRYVLDAVFGDGRGGFLKPLQDRLGRAHDLEVLQARCGPSPRAARDEARERAAAARIVDGLVRRALAELERSPR